jgi:hypothetical protein
LGTSRDKYGIEATWASKSLVGEEGSDNNKAIQSGHGVWMCVERSVNFEISVEFSIVRLMCDDRV